MMVTESLRNRIAAAIQSIRIQRDGDAGLMADAVISELGLRAEWLTEESSRLGIVALTEPQHPIATRIASPWTAING